MEFLQVWLCEWFLGVTLHGFCVSLIRPGVILALYLIIYRSAGSGVGKLPILFWRPLPRPKAGEPGAGTGKTRPNRLGQFLIGVAVGALLWQVFLAGYVFEEFATGFTADRPPIYETPGEGPRERFRFMPESVGTMWRYAGAVTVGLATLVILGWGGFLVVREVAAGYNRVRGWTPATPAGRAAGRSDGDITPRTLWLWTGLVVGTLGMSDLTHVWVAHVPYSRSLGTTLLDTGGWGAAATRRADLHEWASPGSGEEARVEAVPYMAGGKSVGAGRDWFSRHLPVYGAFVLNFGVVALATLVVFTVPIGRLYSPAVGLLFGLHALVCADIVLNFFSPLPLPYFILMLIGLMVLMGRAYKQRFPNLAAYYRDPVRLGDFYAGRPPTSVQAPADATPLRSDDLPFPAPALAAEGKQPLVLVCASGGGSRAAAWTAKVLAEVETAFLKEGVAFPYHIRLMTGASGGMLAAAQYAADLDAPTEAGVVNRTGTLESLFDGACGDFLTPITRTLFTRDALSLLWMTRVCRTDRGVAFDEALATTNGGLLGRTFADLRPGEAAGWRPSLVFSPMLVEDGRQLLISNLDLRQVARNEAVVLGEAGNPPDARTGRSLLSREAVEFFKLFPAAADTFQLATAARMSATFPYILPAVPLPTNPPRRVVDAGYYDNFGVSVAASWLLNHADWVREHASGVVIVQIRDGVSGEARRREAVFDGVPDLARASVRWLTTPPAALYNYRQAAHAFRNDNLLHLIGELYRRVPGTPADFLTTVTFELQGGDDIALNLALTEGEVGRIERAVGTDGFRAQVASLVE